MNWKLNNIDINVHFHMGSASFQTSKLKVFVKKVDGLKPLTIYSRGSVLNILGNPKFVSFLTIKGIERLQKREVTIYLML